MRNMRCLMLAAILAAPLTLQAAGFEVGSPDIPANGAVPVKQVFNGFGCTGQNISPELAWKNAPAGTKSFAVTMYDPDAPTGSGWWHWVVFNLPPSTTRLAANAGSAAANLAPPGSVQSMTDFGTTGYGGPCPPQGDKPHRYIFTVFALKLDKLPVDAKASGAMVGFYLNQNALGKASFTATFGR
jgi:Raf kinase inhibitor-like YbhB/YbcL family protein